MSKRDEISHESVFELASKLEGFSEGYKIRDQIIQLGVILKSLREQEAKLNQTQAAELIGMSQSELSRIESGLGSQGPSYATIFQIMGAYKKLLIENGAVLNFGVEVNSPGHHESYLLMDGHHTLKLGAK